MESVNIEISNNNLSPSLIDQTNHRTAEANLSPSYHNHHHHQTDVIINNFKQTTTTTTTESELINELNMQQQQQTTPTKHISSYHTSSNKENLKNCYTIDDKMDASINLDEPMDIDTSQMLQQTPLNNRVLVHNNNNNNDENNETSNIRSNTKPPISGAKLIKSIRPTGSSSSSNGVSKISFSNDVDDIDFDPFKPKPKISTDLTNSPPPSATTTTNNEIKDEWESHKKNSRTKQQQQQDTSPPVKQISSIVSSNNDLSSGSSSSVSGSPPLSDNQANLVLSATSTSSFSSSSNTNSASSINNINFQTPKSQTYSNNIDILKTPTNHEQEDEEVEKFNNLTKNKFVEKRIDTTVTTEIDNLIDFKLNDFNDEDDVNNTDNNKINETNDYKTEATLNAVESVVFDSIFSNDNDFQSFLDLLEKKEVSSSFKNSPKYSEFARKSLYLQFDPIAQLSKSLSPDKVKRLSLIVDKQEAIKTFLSGIAEEENESGDLLPVVDEQKNENCLNKMENITEKYESKFELDPRFNGETTNNLNETDTNSSQLLVTSPAAQLKQQNTTILDLDQLQLSDSKLINEIKNNNINNNLVDDSLIDELQTFNKYVKPNRVTNNKNDKNNQQSLIETIDDTSNAVATADNSEDTLIAKLINENKALKEREQQNLEQMQLLEEENEKFKTVAIEFEEIFKNLIKDKEESETKLKNEILELTKERGHLQEDVIGVERAFDDLHRRFEKLKTKVEEFKKNEESLQKAIETYKQQLDKEKNKYSTLKKHAEEKLEHANSEIEKLRKSTSIELQTLKAELRKAEIKISSLELSVQQKDQENTQLTNLLEDLLSKVKPNN